MASAPSVENRNRRTGLIAAAGALAMLGMGYAAVPLYRLFCQVTGFGGTTQRATAEDVAKIQIGTEKISVRFDSNIDPDLPWTIRSEQVTQTVKLGERQMAFFYAKNRSNKPFTGTASFNVGGELTVGSAQAAGVYEGTFDVSVEYQ